MSDEDRAQKLNAAREETPETDPQEEQEGEVTGIDETPASSNTAKDVIILLTAVVFDGFALIPFVSVFFNTVFAGILVLAYEKSGGKTNATGKVLATSFIGSIFDFFLSFLPVNTATAFLRITVWNKNK